VEGIGGRKICFARKAEGRGNFQDKMLRAPRGLSAIRPKSKATAMWRDAGAPDAF
jgi:hypothetical protein